MGAVKNQACTFQTMLNVLSHYKRAYGISSDPLQVSNVGSQPQMFQAPSFLTSLAYVTVILATRIQNNTLLNRMRIKYKVHILRLPCSNIRVAFFTSSTKFSCLVTCVYIAPVSHATLHTTDHISTHPCETPSIILALTTHDMPARVL
jgi:hypothetical protein